MSRTQRRNLWLGLAFVSPWIVGFVLFLAFPMVQSLWYSFTDKNVMGAGGWVGLENYRELLLRDKLFRISLYNTLYITLLGVPLSLGLSLVLALMLNLKVRGISFYRTAFYITSIVPAVAASMLWMWVLNPRYGLINDLLWRIGIKGPLWLGSPPWAKPALIIMSLWGVGNTMLIYLSSLQDVPSQLYEAAELDGAGVWSKFRHVTLPMITPVTLFNLIMGIINSFQYFTQAFIVSQGKGGPANSTLFYTLYLYQKAFRDLQMGYAAAMGWILFLIILSLTLLIVRFSKSWVYYEGGER